MKAVQITLKLIHKKRFFPKQHFSAWLSLSPSRMVLLLFHCSVVLKPLRINGFHLVSVFFPLSCGSEQEVEHNELVNEGSLKQRFIERLPFRLFHITHSLMFSNPCHECLCFSFSLKSPLQKDSPTTDFKKWPKC